MFVTLFYGLLDPETGTLSYVNAGHNPPLWFQSATDDLQPLNRTAIALGVLPDPPFEARRLPLCPGDWVLLYSDGLIDATDAAGDRLGLERVQRLLLANRRASAGELLGILEAAVASFTGNTPACDDIALLLLKRDA